MEEAQDRVAVFRQVYEANYGRILAYALRRYDEQEADDVVADTFLVAWRRLADVPTGDLALPWLYGVARKVLSQARRSRLRRGRLLAKVAALRGRDDELAESTVQEDRDLVASALARLSDDDCELLRLESWEDLTHAQIAVAFGCSANAVTVRLHRAHKRFARALASVDREVGGPEQKASA
jgi:RNA polymerase sigma factor (sigma-70 family)